MANHEGEESYKNMKAPKATPIPHTAGIACITTITLIIITISIAITIALYEVFQFA